MEQALTPAEIFPSAVRVLVGARLRQRRVPVRTRAPARAAHALPGMRRTPGDVRILDGDDGGGPMPSPSTPRATWPQAWTAAARCSAPWTRALSTPCFFGDEAQRRSAGPAAGVRRESSLPRSWWTISLRPPGRGRRGPRPRGRAGLHRVRAPGRRGVAQDAADAGPGKQPGEAAPDAGAAPARAEDGGRRAAGRRNCARLQQPPHRDLGVHEPPVGQLWRATRRPCPTSARSAPRSSAPPRSPAGCSPSAASRSSSRRSWT